MMWSEFTDLELANPKSAQFFQAANSNNNAIFTLNIKPYKTNENIYNYIKRLRDKVEFGPTKPTALRQYNIKVILSIYICIYMYII